MDYYKLKTIVMKQIGNHLERVAEIVADGGKPPKFADFQRKLILEHGISAKMIKQMVEVVVPDGTVENGEIVRKE